MALIPLVGWVAQAIINAGLLTLWAVRMLKPLAGTWWKPPIIYDIARTLKLVGASTDS